MSPFSCARPGVFPRRLQPVVPQQLQIALVVASAATRLQIVRRRREVVGAMFPRHRSQRPQALLQALCQRLEALRVRDPHPFPVRVRQHEVICQVPVGLASDLHSQLPHVREIGLALPARLSLLREIHFPLRALQSTPAPHLALQRAQLARSEALRILPLQLLENQLRLKPRIQLQHRLHFQPHVCERILPRPPAPWLDALAGQHSALAPPPRRPLAHARFRRSCRQRLVSSKFLHQ